MKGFSEIRGQLFRTSYDAATGEFVNMPVAHEFVASLDAVETVSSTATSPQPPTYLHTQAPPQIKSESAPAPLRQRFKRSA